MNKSGYVPRQKFSKQEDEIIKQAWKEKGEKCIPELIAILGRNRKQIRDRYFFYLAPGLDNGPFNDEDDIILAKLVSKYGYKWTYFTKFIKGKGTNDVKNRWRLVTSRIKGNDEPRIHRMISNKSISPFAVDYIQSLNWDNVNLSCNTEEGARIDMSKLGTINQTMFNKHVPGTDIANPDLRSLMKPNISDFEATFDLIKDSEIKSDAGKLFTEAFKDSMSIAQQREGIMLANSISSSK